jgi:hypothetical protein
MPPFIFAVVYVRNLQNQLIASLARDSRESVFFFLVLQSVGFAEEGVESRSSQSQIRYTVFLLCIRFSRVC